MINKHYIHVLVFLPFILISLPQLYAGGHLHTFYRETISLNGKWNVIVDPYETGYYNYRLDAFDQLRYAPPSAFFTDSKAKSPSDLIEYDFDRSPVLEVPGDWNTQNEKLYYYEGTVWYRKKFSLPEPAAGSRTFLYFGAVNYKAEVYLNGIKVGTHTGGFTPFHFEVTDLVKPGENSLVVKVDNRRSRDAVPTVNTDWWNYGGITREVKLIVVPEVFVRDYTIKLESVENPKVSGFVIIDGQSLPGEVVLAIPELNIREQLKPNPEGIASFSIDIPGAVLWSPENPRLYRIEIAAGHDRIIDSVGFRMVSVRNKQILLNGNPVFLRGISIHEEYAADGGGRVNAAWKAEQLIQWAKALNCNFVRLAHYPHNEDMVRIAEKNGIMVWSEIPVYWTIDWENTETFMNARNQLTENIMRDKNRANIIIWSIANETPVVPARTDFLSRLAEHARSLDSTRLLSAAMEKHTKQGKQDISIVQDPLADVLDVVSFNEYIGWYDGLPEKCTRTSWEIPYDKPVIVSEFGGGAKYGYHGEATIRWTEEFQEELYVKSIGMLDSINGLAGMTPWILIDFRSPRRVLPYIQDDFNRKGLYSQDGKRKKASYVLQQYYSRKMNE